MNLRLHRLAILFLVILALLSLVAMTPVGLAAGMIGISARNSQGNILNGSLRDASWGRVSMGDMIVHLYPTHLLLGRLAFSASRGNAPHAPGLSGLIGTGIGGDFVDGLTMAIDSNALDKRLAGGEISVENLSVGFNGGRCSNADGFLRINLDRTMLGSALRGDLTGKPSCRNGELVFPLLSQSTMERLQLRVKGNGKFVAILTVSEPSAETAILLTASGFRPVAGGFQLTQTGSLH